MGRLMAVAGAAALLMGGSLAADATPAAVRVVEAEKLRAGADSTVRVRNGARGRVLVLRHGATAHRRLRTGRLRALAVRARVRGCRRGLLHAAVDGRVRALAVGRRWRARRARLRLAPGRRRVQLRFVSPHRRCRAVVDRLRLVGPRRPPERAKKPTRRIPLGSAVSFHPLFSDAAYRDALDATFTSVTPENEMKMEWLQPAEGSWNFAPADAIVDHATARGMEVRGHALVFGQQTPGWVSHKWWPGDARATMRRHIHTVMRRYAGRVRTWDVVNEAFTERGTLKRNVWRQLVGDDYVELAFRYAREADPTARLVYNEFNAETDNPRRAATLDLVRHLHGAGLIDGVGLQVHTRLEGPPTREQLEQTMRLYEQIGVEVEITEMDVLAGGDGRPDTLADRLARQAQIYADAAAACAAVAACVRFTVWGVSDRYSWRGVDQLPLLLDGGFAPKPALQAVREQLALARAPSEPPAP